MIISKTPFRISLAGGGTDFPDYYKFHGGKVLGFTIDKYCYIFFREGNYLMDYNYLISYSKVERVNKIESIKHPSVRANLEYYKINKPFDLLHNADLPARTGLGSSSSFTVGMCNIFRSLKKMNISPKYLAEDAIYIEQKKIKESVGSQDQVFASYGGLNLINFDRNGFKVNKINLSQNKKSQIENNFILMYTGTRRFAANIEKDKINKINQNIQFYDQIKLYVNELYKEINSNKNYLNLRLIGEILDENWRIKKNLSKKVSNNIFNDIYKEALIMGAYGGKLLGAGGGGFYLFVANKNVIKKMKKKFKFFKFINFKLSFEGSQIISSKFI